MAFLSFLRPYTSLPNYLKRTTVFRFKKLHVRIHDISADDGTPFLHNHPFHYMSIVIRGGYTEEAENAKTKYNRWSVIFHKSSFFHRIVNVQPGTKTLFIAIESSLPWALIPAKDSPTSWVRLPPGIYQRSLSGKDLYCKFDVYWHKGHETIDGAKNENSPSINQTTGGVLVENTTSG